MENHHVFMGKIVNINYKCPCSIAMSAMLNYQGVWVHVFSNCNFTAKAAILSQTSGFVRLQEDEPFLSVCFNPSPFSNIFQFQHFSNSKNVCFLNSKNVSEKICVAGTQQAQFFSQNIRWMRLDRCLYYVPSGNDCYIANWKDPPCY